MLPDYVTYLTRYFGTFMLLVVLGVGQAFSEAGNKLEESLTQLPKASLKQKEQLVETLASLKDERIAVILQNLLEGTLYYRKSDKRIVAIAKKDGDYEIRDLLTTEVLGVVSKRKIKKIGVNNKLRRQLRSAIAHLNLSSKKPQLRLQAVNDIIKTMDHESAMLLREHLAQEKNNEIIDLIISGLALVDIKSTDKQTRLAAIRILGKSLLPQARVALQEVLKKNSEGVYLEQDTELRKYATSALEKIASKIKVFEFSETVFFGLSLGSVLLLSAIGLAITFGVMGVINMAHGELMMLGAYTTYLIQLAMPNHIEYSILIAIPAAFLVAGVFGIAIERGVIRFLYGRPLETLLATFGVSLILQQLVRTTISAQNVAVETPAWLSGSLQINPVFSITFNRLYIILFSLMVFVGLLLVLKKTVLGLQVRAVSQNRTMAKAIGVRSEWVDALTFGLGSGIAGIAGVALSQLTNVGPNLGQAYIIDSFMVVVFGGVGNLWGTLVGAMSLGVVNKFLEPWAGAVLAKILVLIFIILFIQKKPRGLFPQKGRAAEN